MPGKCQNEFEKIEGLTRIKVVKLNKEICFGIFDNEDAKQIANEQWHVKNNGYLENGKCQRMTDFIMGPPPEGHVWHHINGLRRDNRRCNLKLVTSHVNKLLSHRKGKKSGLPSGVFKNGSGNYRARGINNNHMPSDPCPLSILGFRAYTLHQKGCDLDDIRFLTGRLSRKEYNEYWKIRNLLCT